MAGSPEDVRLSRLLPVLIATDDQGDHYTDHHWQR
jgi:hypothetical protein